MLIPVLHRLIVKQDDVEEADDVIRKAKAAGIHVQLDKREQAAVEIATVVAKGDTAFKAFETKVEPQIGDKVYIAKYSGKKVKDGTEEYLAINDEDVIAIIKGA